MEKEDEPEIQEVDETEEVAVDEGQLQKHPQEESMESGSILKIPQNYIKSV